MSLARHYAMVAAGEKGLALEKALNDLGAKVRKAPGCEGVEVLRDLSNPLRFVFIEKWVSLEAHKNSANHLPKTAFADVMATLGEKPVVVNFEPLLGL